MLWKSYIDFEIGQEEYENARNLYRRLLQRTRHVKVRILNLNFYYRFFNYLKISGLDLLRAIRAEHGRREVDSARAPSAAEGRQRAAAGSSDQRGAPHAARVLAQDGGAINIKEVCRIVNSGSLRLQKEHGTPETLEKVQREMPRRVKKRRPVVTADGSEAGWQEYYDYIWPTDQGTNLLSIFSRYIINYLQPAPPA